MTANGDAAVGFTSTYGAVNDNAGPSARPSDISEDVRYITQDELTDLRAMQRTFDLAYLRTALSELSFGVLVIKLFDSRFQVIGAIYALICATIAGIALWRSRLALRNQSKITVLKIAPTDRDEADSQGGAPHQDDVVPHTLPPPSEAEALLTSPLSSKRRQSQSAITTASTASQHVIVNEKFRTAGDVILALVGITFVLECVILYFLLDLT